MNTRTLTALAVLTAAAASANAGIVVNGTFDGGTIAPAVTAYTQDATMWPEGTYNVVSYDTLHSLWVDFYDHTSGNGESGYLVVNGTTQGAGPVWTTNVSVDAGTEYELSAWLASLYPQAISSVSLRVLGITGDNGNPVLAASDVTAPNDLGVWERRAMSFNSAGFTSLRLEIWDTNQVASGNDYAVDDIALTAVPTPGTAAFGLAALTAGSRRRRR